MPSSPDVEVGIIGLRALRADIHRMTDEYRGPLIDAIKAAGREVCDPIANAARERLPMSDRPDDGWHKSGRLVASVRTYATKTGAGVRMGRGGTVTYAGWVEFGGKRHRPKLSTRAFGFHPRGTYLYPAAYEMAPMAAGRYQQALTRAFNATGLWTNDTNDPQSVHD